MEAGDECDQDQVYVSHRYPDRRCTACKDGPMFHPEHRWRPCWVRLPNGEECGCTVGVRQPPAR